MVKKILVVLAVVLVIAGVVISRQPDTYRVERSITVDAPAPIVFAQVSDFNKSGAWSPWDKLDPNMTKDIEGEPSTVGHKSSWKGNKDVGSGSQTLTKVEAPTQVEMKLEFIEPFPSTAMAGFTIVPEGPSSKVTWWMDGTNDFMGKAFSLAMDMDKMIGDDFNKGLAALKPIAEQEAVAMARAEAERKAAEDAAAAESANTDSALIQEEVIIDEEGE